MVVATLVVAIVVIGTVGWIRLQPSKGPCVGVGAMGPPATSPEAAVDAWWAQSGPQDVQRWIDHDSAPPQPPTRVDFTRMSDTSWEWRYNDRSSVVADIEATESGAWVVSGVGGCTFS